MNCPKCQTQNEGGAQFCRNCGTNLHYTQGIQQKKDISSILLVTYIIIVLVTVLAQDAIKGLDAEYYKAPTIYFYAAISIVRNISYILPALAIKNKTMRVVGIIMASILIVIQLIKYVL